MDVSQKSSQKCITEAIDESFEDVSELELSFNPNAQLLDTKPQNKIQLFLINTDDHDDISDMKHFPISLE